MINCQAWLPAILLSLLLAAEAQAHRPYVTQRAPITLPDGSTGEMLVMAGDGVILADPERLLIFNAAGNLIGRGPGFSQIEMICKAPGECYGYDHSSFRIQRADSASFQERRGMTAATSDEEKLGNLLLGDMSWGVYTRRATITEALYGEWVALQTASFTALFGYFGAGAIIGGVCMNLHLPKRRTFQRLTLWLASTTLLSGIISIIALLALYSVWSKGPATAVFVLPGFAGFFFRDHAAFVPAKVRCDVTAWAARFLCSPWRR